MASNNTFANRPIDTVMAEQATSGMGLRPTTPTPNEPRPAMAPPPALQPLFENAATKYEVPVNILMAIAEEDTGYDPKAIAVGPDGTRSRGVMSSPDLRAGNPFSPAQAIDLAARRIRERMDAGLSPTDVLMERAGGPDRTKWGPDTVAYKDRVAARARRIADELYPLPAKPQAMPQPKPDQPGDPADPSFLSRLGESLSFGYEGMTRSLDTTRTMLGGGWTPEAIDKVAANIVDATAAAQAMQGKRHPQELEIEAALDRFGESEGFLGTLAAAGDVAGTAITNPAGLALGTAEQIPNMLPTIGGAIGGAGVGAGAGAAAGSVVPGAGTAAGAAVGGVWGGRVGAGVGTAAGEFGNEVQYAIQTRLAEAGKPVTRETVAELLSDPAMQDEITKQAALKGITLGTVDALFFGLAGKVGAMGKTARGKAGAAAGAAGIELAGEPAGEAASQAVARGEIDKGDVAAEALYGAATSAGTAAVATGIEQGAKAIKGLSRPPTATPTATPAAGPTPQAPAAPQASPVAPAAPVAAPPQPPVSNGPLSRALAAGQPVVPDPESDTVPIGARVAIVTESGMAFDATIESETPSSFIYRADDGTQHEFSREDVETGLIDVQLAGTAAPAAPNRLPAPVGERVTVKAPDGLTIVAGVIQAERPDGFLLAADDGTNLDIPYQEIDEGLVSVVAEGVADGAPPVGDIPFFDQPEATQPAAPPMPSEAWTTGEDGMLYDAATGEPFEEDPDVQPVRDAGAPVLPADDVRAEGDEEAPTAGAPDPAGVRGAEGVDDGAARPNPATPDAAGGAGVPDADGTADAQPALTPEPAPAPEPVKWFGSKAKADDYIAKKKLGETHEIVRKGMRFEVTPKAVATAAKADEPPLTGRTFKTAKGSTYAVHADGSTSRNKAARPEHPGENERGPQPRSEQTFYVRPADVEKLSLMQTQGGDPMRVEVRGKIAAISFTGGEKAGKVIRDTLVDIESEPDVGLTPVELWKGGARVHFGNEITEVGGAPVETPAAAEPKKKLTREEAVAANLEATKRHGLKKGSFVSWISEGPFTLAGGKKVPSKLEHGTITRVEKDGFAEIVVHSPDGPTQRKIYHGARHLEPSDRNEVEGKDENGVPFPEPTAEQIAALDPVTTAANEAATSPTNDLPEPTQAQKEAGNYKLGHVKLGGLDLSIENPAGSERKGVDKGGKPWSVKLGSHYGYIKRTEGKDGDHVDAFVKPGVAEIADDAPVFVVNQRHPDAGSRKYGGFDEHKVMVGFTNEAEARDAYLANYAKDWKGLGSIVPMKLGEFKSWLKDGDTTKPVPSRLARMGKKAEPAPVAPVDNVTIEPKGIVTEKDVAQNPAVYQGRVGQYRVIARRAEPWSVELGFGATPEEAEADGRRKVDTIQPTAPTVEAPKDRGPHFAAGRKAFAAGSPREAPSYFTGPSKNRNDWYKGWDDAKLATGRTTKPAPPTPLAKDEHPGLIIQSLQTGKRTTIQPIGTKPPVARTVVGQNADGETIEADDRGVRSVVSGGVRSTETVGVSPDGRTSVDPSRRGSRFTTREEAAAQAKPTITPDRLADLRETFSKGLPTNEGLVESVVETKNKLAAFVRGLSDDEFNTLVEKTGQSSNFAFPTVIAGVSDIETADKVIAAWNRTLQRAQPTPKPEPAPQQAPAYGASNKLVSASRAEEVRAKLKAKLRGQLNAGIDPEVLALGAELAAYHLEAGARKFADVARAIAGDLDTTVDKIKPYLRAWYNGARDMMEDSGLDIEGTDDAGAVRAALATIGEEAPDGRGDVQGEGAGTLDEVAPAEGGGAEVGGPAGVEPSDGGGVGAGAGERPDGAGVSPARGGGGRAPRVRAPAARKERGAGSRGPRAGGNEPRAGRDDEGDARVEPEAPSAPNIPAANFQITEDVDLGKGGEVQKFNDNLAAIRALKAIEAENRRATPEEQRTLARYVGWGGLPNAFADPTTGEFKAGWQTRGEELRDALTKDELTAARRSTRNAHYTSEVVVTAMWDAARRLGFKGGLALESSMGTGNFLGLMPSDMNARFVGIEYDSITARIGAALYPQATVLHSGFQKVPLADNAFALAIGNPPFGSESLRFQFKPELAGASIHNQFFRASLDAVRPGGLQIMVVSRFLLDAQDTASRMALASKAKLVAAIRLPDNAFKGNARTEVVTDIIILQKMTPDEQARMAEAVSAAMRRPEKDAQKEVERQAAITRLPRWIETTEVADPLGGDVIRVNTYFADRPGQIIGTLERSGSMQHGNDVTVRLDDVKELPSRLAALVAKLPEGIHDLDAEVMAATEDRFRKMSDALRIALAAEEPGHVKIEDGKLSRVIERETPEGEVELARQEITPRSPWSDQLYMDAEGRWYRNDVAVGEDGKPIKAVNEQGKTTKRNTFTRTVFERETDVPDGLRLGETRYERLLDIVKLRDLLKRQLKLETDDARVAEMENNRRALNAAYQSFVAKHGPVNRSANSALASTMPDGALVQALEISYQPERTEAQAKKSGLPKQTEKADPAPILTKRVVPKYEPATKADSPADALTIALSETGRVSMPRIAELLRKSEAEAAEALQAGEKPLIFRDPETETWETADAYLSGMVKRKLVAAREAGLSSNVEALEKVIPEDWTAENVTVQMGSTWVPTDVYASFFEHLSGAAAKVTFSRISNAFSVAVAETKKAAEWSTDGASLNYLASRMINSQTPTVTYKDADGKLRVDQDATTLAVLKTKEIITEFSDWVFADSERRQQLVGLFNEQFNTRVNRQFDGSHLKLPGKVPDSILAMRRHQNNAIWRGVSQRFMLVDHAVGAGKTFMAIARAMERRRMGLSRKPVIVVPNHLVEQWAIDVYRLYPGAKVLAAGSKDFETKRRRRLFAKIATGDWDIVITPHSSFGFIGIAPETESRFLEQEMKEATDAIADAWEQAEEDGTNNGRRKPFGVKEAERLAEKIQGRMDKLSAGKRDRLLTFEQLGIDDLTIDEAHEFKNLFYSSRLTGVRGMGDKTGSAKANDLYNKVRVLRDSPTGAITFMTGTPISNSAVEMYTMMRYLAADSLEEMGLSHFDAWRAQFVEATPAFEPTESGKLKEVTRLGRTWSNMRSLMDLYYQFTDSVSLDDIKRWYPEDNGGRPFPVPKAKGGDRRLIAIKPTRAQAGALVAVMADFDGLEFITDPMERNAERLRLMDRARKISLDIRAVDPRHPSTEEGGKLETASREIKRIYDKWTPDRGTQLVFLDRSVPKAKGDDKIIKAYDALVAKRDAALAADDEAAFQAANDALEEYDAREIAELRAAQNDGWNAYRQIKEHLVAAGIPADEIRFIQEAQNDEQKKALFDAVNGGRVRVLIGSTPRMGAGTNVQKRAVALHHIDVTWKPSDIEQREGRVIRQGNELLEKYGPTFEVEILAYATERTVDAKMWDLNATKLRTINGIRKYDGAFVMEFEDSESVSMAEMAALASGSPLLMERVTLDSQINNLELEERAHRRKLFGAKDALVRAQELIKTGPDRIAKLETRSTHLTGRFDAMDAAAAKRSVTVDGKPYSKIDDALAAARDAIAAAQAADAKAKYKIEVDGTGYTNKSDIDSAIEAALGDAKPFEMTVQGEPYIARTAAARKLAEIATATVKSMGDGREDADIDVGTFLAMKVELSVAKSVFKGAPMTRLTLSVFSGNEVIADADTAVNSAMGQPLGTNTLRPLVTDVEKRLRDRASPTHAASLTRLLEAARDDLPSLEARAQQAFPKAEEIAEKRARLKAVIQEIEASKGLSGGMPRADDVEIEDDADYDDTPMRNEAVETLIEGGFESAEAIDAHLRKGPLGDFVGRLIDNGTITLHGDNGLQLANFGQMAPGVRGLAEKGGRIDLIASALTRDNALPVLLHEAFHAGVEPLIGSQRWTAMLQRVSAILRAQEARAPGERSMFWRDALNHLDAVATPRDRRAEELAAYAIDYREAAPDGFRTTLDNLLGALKAWLLKRFGVQAGAVTPGQIVALAKAALRRGWDVQPDGGGDGGGSRANTTPPAPGAPQGGDRKLGEVLSQTLTQHMPKLLALAPLRPMIEEIGKNLSAAQRFLATKQAMDTMRQEWHAAVDKTAQRWVKYRSANVTENAELMAIMHESTLAQTDPTLPFKPLMTPTDWVVWRNSDPDGDQWKAVDKLVKRDVERRRAYKDLKARYATLSQEGKNLYVVVRDSYTSMADEFERVTIANLDKALDTLLDSARTAYAAEMDRIRRKGLRGQAKQNAEIDADKALRAARARHGWNKRARMAMLRDKFEQNRLDGPYFPLARFGNLFVTVRDADGEVISFSRFEKVSEQVRFAKEMRADPDNVVEVGALDDTASARPPIDPTFVADVEQMLEGAGAPDALKDALWQRYLETLPDMSIRKSRIHRLGRKGFTGDALRAFGHHMFHGAHQLARLAHGQDLAQHIKDMEKEAENDADPVRARMLVNEIKKRHNYILNPEGAWWAQAVATTAFVYHLSVSPAAAMVNLTQTVMVGVPVLGAYAGGMRGIGIASAELTRAMTDFTRGVFSQGAGQRGATRSVKLTADEKDAMLTAYDIGLAEKTQAHDMAAVAETGVEYSARMHKVMSALSAFFHQAERFNREVTFLAGYRIARKKNETHEEAIKTAASLTWKTHFDYQNTSRPRFMQRDAAKAIFVFRNFNVNMLFRLFRDTHQSINAENAADRKAARMQLGGITGMMALNAGVRGTWLFGMAMMIAGLFAGEGDDPEEDLKRGAVEWLGPELAGLILDGVPGYLTETSLSQRIGMPDLWFRSPDRQLEGEDVYNYWVEQMLGAAPAPIQNAIRGFYIAKGGDVYRGIETAAPKAIKDIMRTARYATEGVQTMKGEDIIPADEISFADLFKQAIGFTPAIVAEQYGRNRAMKNREQAILKARTRLLSDYARAFKADDPDAMANVEGEIDAFNDRNPDYPIGPDNIRTSLKGRARASDRMEGGVLINPNLNERIRGEAAPSIYR